MSVAIARGQTWSCLQDHFPRHGNAPAPSKGARTATVIGEIKGATWEGSPTDQRKLAELAP